jgi:hypothetical protein
VEGGFVFCGGFVHIDRKLPAQRAGGFSQNLGALIHPQPKAAWRMNPTDKKNLVKWNTILWLAAMVLPAFFSFAFASAKFPWPIIVPLLLVGPMLASNKMLMQAMGESGRTPQSN